MKLPALALVTSLGFGGIALADAAPSATPAPSTAPAPAADPADAQLEQLLVSQFDGDHNGQLDANERHRALHALRRIARRMKQEDRAGQPPGSKPGDPAVRQARIQHLIQRFDRNHDGVVSPDEMPPGLAHRLPAIDRNGDGSIDPRDAR